MHVGLAKIFQIFEGIHASEASCQSEAKMCLTWFFTSRRSVKMIFRDSYFEFHPEARYIWKALDGTSTFSSGTCV